MIKLSDGCYVAADQIAEITVNDYGSNLKIRMKSGIGHNHEPQYKESIYQALDRLLVEVNTELRGVS